jgi:hypothetical protein
MSTPGSMTIAQHFEGKHKDVRATYDRIMAIAREWGDIAPVAKKTAIQLPRPGGGGVFASIATRKDALILTVKAESDIRSPRVTKREQTSANRWHVEVRLENAKQIDHELQQWMRASYKLAE